MKNLLKKLFKKRNVTLIVNGRKYKCDTLEITDEPGKQGSSVWRFSLLSYEDSDDGYFMSVETNGPFIIETNLRS